MRNIIAAVAAASLLCSGLSLALEVRTAERAASDVRPEYNLHTLHPAGGGARPMPAVDRSMIARERALNRPTTRSSSSTVPAPSPGMAIGQTMYDMQHHGSQGYQVARTASADVVHFVWTNWWWLCGGVGECDRYVAYNSYTISSGVLNGGFDGVFVSLGELAHAGFTNLSVNGDNEAQVTLHQTESPELNYSPWHLRFPTPGEFQHEDTKLSGFEAEPCPEVLWPRVAASRDGATIHIISHSVLYNCPTSLLWYWRFDGTMWTGPVVVDSTPWVSYVLADDPTGNRFAIAVGVDNHAGMNGLNNIAYLESQTDGAGWITGNEAILKNVITGYSDPTGPQAWSHISAAYDNAGALHIIWDEQRVANSSNQAAIRHWSNARHSIRTVTEAHWPSPWATGNSNFNLNLAKMTLGIGDGGTTCNGGTNTDYLYVLCTRFGGPSEAEQADHSALGYYNGELYLSVSADGGLTWSAPRNLTNTKTPDCFPGYMDTWSGIPQFPDSVCRSEDWATIGQTVSDIDILFVSDKDAGAAPYGEGTWQLNPVHYLRLAGGGADAPYVCPQLNPVFAAALPLPAAPCGFVSEDGVDSAFVDLTIGNPGNAQLSGTATVNYLDSPPAPWLSISGAQSLPFTVPKAGADITLALAMAPDQLPDGTFGARVDLYHNDTAQTNPKSFAVDFHVRPCVCHGDPVCDGMHDVLDVIAIVDRAFRGATALSDVSCPRHASEVGGRTDLDCSGVTNVVDVVLMVGVAFRNNAAETAICHPCAP